MAIKPITTRKMMILYKNRKKTRLKGKKQQKIYNQTEC